MKQWLIALAALILAALLCACGAPAAAPEPTPDPTPAAPTPAPTAPPEPQPEEEGPAAPAEPTVSPLDGLSLPAAQEGWTDAYLTFIDDNYDIIAALWPEGVTGVGFIDLDLDGTPEMLLFDPGASAAMGVHLFDLVDGRVVCAASSLPEAAAAFGTCEVSSQAVCVGYFESFRLVYAQGQWRFWVVSMGGTPESSWEELIRFGSDNGVVTLQSACARYIEYDLEADMLVGERFTADGEDADETAYSAVMDAYTGGDDAGYEAAGVFLWNDMTAYDTTYEGLMAMARGAVDAYVPIQ